MAISDYEKKRLENIKRNQELLQSLQVPKSSHATKKDLNKTRTNSAIKKHTPKKASTTPAAPSRTSARLRGVAADNIEVDGANNKTAIKDYIIAPKPAGKRSMALDDKDHDKFIKLLESANATIKEEDIKVDPSLEPLQQQFENLRIQHPWATVKVVPERITQCLFHPGKAKLLVIAASMSGHLGFWDVNNKEDDTDDPVVYAYRPSTRGITGAKFCLSDPATLYLSSYDGSLQTFDMNTAQFGSVKLADDHSISHFDITQDGHVIYFSTSDGELGVRDRRSKSMETLIQAADKKKVGCVDLNPVHTDLLVTASNDRTAKLWDVRYLEPEGSLQTLTHNFAVTGAYWSPNGQQLATSCYDDNLRVFDLQTSKQRVNVKGKIDMQVDLKGKISHNCHTGKWITMFRTVWNQNRRFGMEHPHFVVGSMKHPACIYSGESVSKIVDLYDEDRITAIPAVNEFHPTLDTLAMVSGNGSGRVVCWT